MSDQLPKEKLPYSNLYDAIEAYITAAYEHYQGGAMTPMISTLSAISNATALAAERVVRSQKIPPHDVSIVKEMHVMHEWLDSHKNWEQEFYTPAVEEINS